MCADELRAAVRELIDAHDADGPDECADITGAEWLRQLDAYMERKRLAWERLRALMV